MKQNLSQIQYEQLAREQFCNRLKEIPFVSDIEVLLEKKNAPLGDFKAKVYLEEKEKCQKQLENDNVWDSSGALPF